MPVFVRKHWRIIQRSEIRARLCLTSFFTDPPPTSAEGCSSQESARAVPSIQPTAMASCEPHLVHVRLPVLVVVVLVVLTVSNVELLQLLTHMAVASHIATLDMALGFLGRRVVPVGGAELGAMLVERYGMAKVAHRRVRGGEWKSAWNNAHRCDGVPNRTGNQSG